MFHKFSYNCIFIVLDSCHRFTVKHIYKGARWRSGRASDSESRGHGFDPHRHHRVVSLSKTH